MSDNKEALYATTRQQLAELLAGLDDPVAVMASTAAVLHHRVLGVSWTGFYRLVEPDLLRVGPYQGDVGCLEIPLGSGVCGTAAARRQTVIVKDVHAFEGHIACDAAAQSEIVVPVFNATGELSAVLDLDSHSRANFDDIDRRELEKIAALISSHLGSH